MARTDCVCSGAQRAPSRGDSTAAGHWCTAALPDVSLRGPEVAVAISQHQPEHGKAFGESVSACHALSVTFGDSSPRGRAKVASLPAMTREGGACKFVTMPLRMGWVSPSCHCILPVAAGSQVCHCEPCGARRGNLAAPAGTRESFWRIRKCLPCPLSHLR